LKKIKEVGGQAVIEGVMMRSPEFISVAIRRANGEIFVKRDPYVALTKRFKFLNIPIIRGVIVLVETLYIGVKTLMFSADEAMKEVSPKTKEKKSEGGFLNSLWIFLMVILGVGLGVLIFFYLPLIFTDLLKIKGGVLFNLVDGVIRLTIFLAYIYLISLWKDMRRIFEYHGSEHKSIYTLESGKELTVENAMGYSTLHPRCGTSFLLIVVIVSILVFMFLGRPHTFMDRLIRLSFIPLIAGISYELIKLSGRTMGSKFAKILTAPGLWLQRITTKEPDEKQLEVAIASLKSALNLPLQEVKAGEQDSLQ